MSAALPCFKCGAALDNALDGAVNQPYAGTEFTTTGHYGSTFWDLMGPLELILNVCDECLETHKAFLAVRDETPVPRVYNLRPYSEYE